MNVEISFRYHGHRSSELTADAQQKIDWDQDQKEKSVKPPNVIRASGY